MVKVNYIGTLGNNLWQYCVARSIAEKYGLKLQVKPIDGFENTKQEVDGNVGVNSVKVIQTHILPPIDENSNVYLNGYFCKYRYLRPYKENIKEWLYLPKLEKDFDDSDELVLTIRRGWNGWPTKLCPDVEFYIDFIKNNPQYKKITLCTDSFDDVYFEKLNPYIDNFIKESPIEQFRYIMSSKNILLSSSTFSWWAAYLSDAKTIYYPWFGELIPNDKKSDWVVTDEKRYKYINLKGEEIKVKKNILVTGGAGFVGTNLVKRLVEEGHNVTSIDNYYTGLKENHQEGVTYIEKDICDIDDYSTYGNFDLVYHLAAIARIQPSFNLPLEYFNSNSVATYKLALYCAKNNIPLQFAGSSSHHSGKFKNPYTFSKDVSEEIVQLCQEHYGLNATITRFYNVYGPHHLKEGGYCTVIGKWEKAIEDGEPITIYGDGTKRRDFTHIDDIVDALILIQDKHAWGYLFELGRGVNYSIKEVADMFEYDNIVYEENKPGEAETTLCEDTLAKDILGWVPTKNLTDYIKDYVSG